jgi:putative MATE family efflux protein
MSQNRGATGLYLDRSATSSTPALRPAAVHTQSLLAISWPVMITLAVGISGPIIDSWFLSRVSDDAAAGVGATLPVFVLLQTMLNALGQAGAGVAGQYLGSGRPRLAAATFTLMVSLLACGGLLLGALLSLSSPWVVYALGLRGDIAGHSVEFLRIIGAGFVGRALIAGLTNLLAARGLTLWNLGVSIAIVGLNVIFNMLLVGRLFGLPCLGVQGVAMATVLSWGIVSLGTLALVIRRLGFHPSWLQLFLGWKRVLRHLVRIGVPSAIEPIAYQLFQVALASQVVRLGTFALTARVYAANLANLPVLFSYGLGFGAQILVSHLVGARDYATAKRRLKAAVAWGAGLSFVTSLVLAACGHELLGLFSRDPGIVALGALLLWVDVLVQPAKAANIAITFSLRASGDSRFPAIVGSTLMWTVGIGTAFALAFGAGWGVIGIWLGMAVDEWTRALVNGWRWRSGAWQSKGVT